MGESELKLAKREEMFMSCAGVQTVAGRVQVRWESESAATPMGKNRSPARITFQAVKKQAVMLYKSSAYALIPTIALDLEPLEHIVETTAFSCNRPRNHA